MQVKWWNDYKNISTTFFNMEIFLKFNYSLSSQNIWKLKLCVLIYVSSVIFRISVWCASENSKVIVNCLFHKILAVLWSVKIRCTEINILYVMLSLDGETRLTSPEEWCMEAKTIKHHSVKLIKYKRMCTTLHLMPAWQQELPESGQCWQPTPLGTSLCIFVWIYFHNLFHVWNGYKPAEI